MSLTKRSVCFSERKQTIYPKWEVDKISCIGPVFKVLGTFPKAFPGGKVRPSKVLQITTGASAALEWDRGPNDAARTGERCS